MGIDQETTTGIVVIGRNEGQRLVSCFESIPEVLRKRTIYVDSGSSDNSIHEASCRGISTCLLDMSQPFTAGRARDTGFRQIVKAFPELNFIHFIDGDCTFADNWLPHAIRFLLDHPQTGVICGRLKERYPDRSVYNRACDIEWTMLSKNQAYCGGTFLIRVDAYLNSGGFNTTMIAGEEPELCRRIRSMGFGVATQDTIMGFHDANILTFRQWWLRNTRTGFAYAESQNISGRFSSSSRSNRVIRTLFWSSFLPFAIVTLSLQHPAFLTMLVVYPIQMMRIAINLPIPQTRHKLIYGGFVLLAKFPETMGIIKFMFSRLLRVQHSIIEYKQP